jgi:hypothetical protein
LAPALSERNSDDEKHIERGPGINAFAAERLV